MKKATLMTLMMAGMVFPVAAQTPDVVVNLGWIGDSAWTVESVDPVDAGVVTSTGSGNPNPTMTLSIGTRYLFVNAMDDFHPFSIISQGTPSDLLLRQGDFRVGVFDNDVGVNWDNSPVTDMAFTLTPQLADALMAKLPRYICENHPSMIGEILFSSQPSPFDWPGGTESFENAVLGSDLVDSFDGWSIVNPSSDYTAVISDTPVGDPGQASGSTRWVKVSDSDPVESNRIYPPATITSEGIASYDFTWLMNVESIGGGAILLVTQHFAAPYDNVGGIEIEPNGTVNVVLLGSDDGGIGKAGATVREELYTFTDSGGFGENNWVTIGFEVDFENGRITGHATGSDGVTQVSAVAAGLDLQNAAEEGNFRWCMRNNAADSVSVINYDNLVLTGVEVDDTRVDSWQVF